jgi:hypothetical protein
MIAVRFRSKNVGLVYARWRSRRPARADVGRDVEGEPGGRPVPVAPEAPADVAEAPDGLPVAGFELAADEPEPVGG